MKMELAETLPTAPSLGEAVGSMPRRAALPWRPLVIQATAIWAVTRLAFAALTYYAVFFSSGNRALTSNSVPARALLHAWDHWDVGWYLRIATDGYWSPQPTAFFPLYPALIHLLIGVVGVGHALAAAMLIANLGTLGAFIGLALLAANEEGTVAAWRALRVFIAYPLALFLTVPYTEGIFVAFVTGALFSARRGSWRWAALWALLAGLTRPTGLALILPLLWEYGRQHDWWRKAAWRLSGWREHVRPKALAEATLVIGAVPASVGGYMLFCLVRFGDPIMFVRAERIYWNHVKSPPWTTLWLAIGNVLQTPLLSELQARLLMDFVPLVVFIVLTFVGIRRLPLMFTLYNFGILYFSIASPITANRDVLISVGRYLIAAVPVFLLLSRWTERRPWLDTLLVTTGLLLQAIFTVVYLHNGLVY